MNGLPEPQAGLPAARGLFASPSANREWPYSSLVTQQRRSRPPCTPGEFLTQSIWMLDGKSPECSESLREGRGSLDMHF